MQATTTTRATLDGFTRAYIEAMLWAETDNTTEQGGEPLDANYGLGDIAPETLRAIIDDCQQFQEANRADLERYNHPRYTWQELGGHDYWLTRNHHGAGYWDRDCLPDDCGERLTQAAHNAGELSPYVGDDSLIYLA
jgi:hypothetical protein